MKKYFILFILFSSYNLTAQVFGLSYQTTTHSDQFALSINVPYNNFEFDKENKIRIDYGIDFISADKDIFSGIYLKPANIVYDFNTLQSKKTISYTAISVEPAFLFNNSKGTNGFTISPSIYYDFFFLYLKSGYEYHFNDRQSQVYFRVGFTFGYSLMKVLRDVPISKI
jgi:hypothetical protein